MNFNTFQQKKRNGGLSTKSLEDLQHEIQLREKTENIFPLEVFNDSIKPFIEALNQKYDIPRSFIGLSLLSAYSTAIGTAYTVSTNGSDHFFLAIWGCLLGISSSGKSLSIGKAYDPIFKIQMVYDKEWEEIAQHTKESDLKFERMKTIYYRDSHIPTLVRSVLPDNPKGIMKWPDEILEWINGMNALSKQDGIDEQFWLSTWNCASYSAVRGGKQKFTLKRPFVNVLGGVQYKLLYKLFAKDRDSSGFIFRLLFAVPNEIKVSDADPHFVMPEEWSKTHDESIRRLYFDLPVNDGDEPKRCVLSKPAVDTFQLWCKLNIRRINALEYVSDKEIESGIYGKIKEYALRFAALLHLSDKALNQGYTPITWRDQEIIDASTMERALKIADYFYQSALDTVGVVDNTTTAPPEVIQVAALVKLGKTGRQIALIMWNDESEAAKRRMNRLIKDGIKKYPKVFNATAR